MCYINWHLHLHYITVELTERHGFHPHLYADDTQIYGSNRQPAINDQRSLRLSACIDDIYSWMQSNRLQLNTNKSELLWCTTARWQYQLPKSVLRIGTDAIIPSTSVRDLGIFIDTDLSMRSHVQRTVASCFVMLWQLRSIRQSVPSSVYQTVVVALVLTRLDYGNATLAGIPATLINRLQSVVNAAARSIAGDHRSPRITDTLASFHWLRTSERIQFKLAVIVYRALHGTAPQYLSDRPTASRCWHTVKTSSLIIAHWSSWRSSDSPRHCRRPLIFYCQPHAVEQFAKWHYICLVAASVSSLTEDIGLPVSAVIPGHCYCTIVVAWSFPYLGHYK